MKNVHKLFVLLVAVLVFVPTLALGATIKAGEEVSTQKGDEIQDNVYIAGGNVSIGSDVSGDVFVAGGSVLISGNVSDDIVAGGGSITILGDSNGDVRVVGGNILIAGDVSGELIITGGSVVVSPDVSVGKDVVVAGGQISIDGDVEGDVQAIGGVVTINGHVYGDVQAKVDNTLTIGDGAVIDGALAYSARNAETLRIGDGAVVAGGTVFTEVETISGRDKAAGEAKNYIFAFIGVFFIFKILACAVTALVLVWLFKNFSNTVVKNVVKTPLRMLGKGFVTLVVVPVASILLFMTLFGVPLGVVTVLSYGLLLLISSIYAGVIAGAWTSLLIHKLDTPVITWRNVIGGVALLTVVKLIPLVGWIAGLGILLVSLGSIVDSMQKKLWGKR